MKWSLLDTEEETKKEIPRGEPAGDSTLSVIPAHEPESSASSPNSWIPGQARNDNDLGVKPLSSEPERISLLSHFTFTFLIIAIVAGALAGAGWYFRDEVIAGFARYNMSVEKVQKYTIRTLDDPANNVGQYTSITIGRDGYPTISYLDPTAWSLKFYKCNDVVCTSGVASTLDDPASLVGLHSSIAIGQDGYPVISYQDLGATSLKLYKCNDVACTTGTASTLDDPANTVGYHTSIAIGQDGYPVISYYDATARSLKLYKCNDVACSTGTASTLDDPANQVGQYTSIAIGRDGYPIISYYDFTAKSLKLYKCNDVACTTGTASTLDDPTNEVGTFETSIAIGRDGYPVISYYDVTAQDLKLLKCGNVSCTATSTMTIDSPGDVGQYTSMKIGNDGYPVISYYDATNQSLKFAYVGNRVTMNTSPKTIETDGLVGYWTFDGQDITGTSTVLDRSSSHATGTMVNMATSSRVMGKHGQGLNFDGVNGYINAGSPAQLDDLSAFTYSAWVKPVEIVYGADTLAAAKGAASACGVSTYRGWLAHTYASNPRGLEFCVAFSGGTLIKRSQQGVMTPDTWHHVVYTWSGTTSASGVHIYLDGTEVPYAGTQDGSGSYVSDSTDTLLIGKDHYGGSLNTGTADDVRIYNRVLSADEISKLYGAGAGIKQGICGEGGVRDADGNVYGIVQIGTQCWLDRNMNVGTMINAGTAQQFWNGTIEKYCYSNTDSNCTTNHPKRPDGGLYQWWEATQGSSVEGAQGICPTGWHIPSDAEWNTLESFLKDNGQTCVAGRTGYDCSGAGTRLKSSGESIFEANYAGYSQTGGSFNTRDTIGSFWSSTGGAGSAQVRDVNSGQTGVDRLSYIDTRGFSIRCIKDAN